MAGRSYVGRTRHEEHRNERRDGGVQLYGEVHSSAAAFYGGEGEDHHRTPKRENAFNEQVEAFPFNFDNPRELTRSLEGATTVCNTYWIRFLYGGALLTTPLRTQRRCSSQQFLAARNILAGLKGEDCQRA